MLTYDFEHIKKVGQNVLFNDRILVCWDNTAIAENGVLHTHNFYEIQYVYNGEGIGLTSTSNPFSMKAGFISIFRPGVAHTYFSTNNMELVNICFIPTEAQKNIISYMSNYDFTLDDESKVEFEMLYYILRQTLTLSKPQNIQKSDIYLNTILNLLTTISHSDNSKMERWNHLLLHISENLPTITLSKAAELCNCSTSFFCRTFKRDFGQTFIQYLDNMRLEKAKALLKSSNMSIDEISRTVGFSHNTRFYKLFQGNTGLTPNQFKNSVKHQQGGFGGIGSE